MHVRVDRLEIHETGGLYAELSAWVDEASFLAGDPPLAEEDFIFPNFQVQGTRIIKRGDGAYRKVSGGWMTEADILAAIQAGDPLPAFQTETFNHDLRQEAIDALTRWRDRLLARPELRGKRKGPARIRPDDPRGLRGVTSLFDLEGTRFDV